MQDRSQPSTKKQPANSARRPAQTAESTREDAALSEEQLEAVAGGKDVKASSSGPDWD